MALRQRRGDGGERQRRRANVRPTGNLVVEMVPAVVHADAARAYVERGEMNEDPYVVVRTEVPDSRRPA